MKISLSDHSWSKLAVLSIFLIAAGLIYSRAWPRAPIIRTDSPQYIEVAIDLQDLKLDSIHDRVPGYPLLLLLTSSTTPTRSLFYIQIGLHLLSVLLLVYILILQRVSGTMLALFVFLSLIPPSVENTAVVLTETWAQFFLVLSMFALILWLQSRRVILLVAAGFAFAFSALIRPTYQFLFVPVIFLLVIAAYSSVCKKFARPAILSAASVLVFSVLIIGGFAFYNYMKFNFFGLTPLLGFNLSTRTVRVVERLPDSYAQVREILVKSRDSDLIDPDSSHSGGMYIWQTIPILAKATNLSKPELSKYMQRINLLLIKKAPIEYLKEVGEAAIWFWFPSSTLSNFNSRALQLLWTVIHFIVIILFFTGVILLVSFRLLSFKLGPELRAKITTGTFDDCMTQLTLAIPITIVLYTMIVSTMVEVGSPRYRIPVDLFIFFTVVLCLHVWTKISPIPKSSGIPQNS